MVYGTYNCTLLGFINQQTKRQRGPHIVWLLIYWCFYVFFWDLMGFHGILIDMIRRYDLVGGISTPLKNMKVIWDDYSQYMEKIKVMFQSPPTSDGIPSGNDRRRVTRFTVLFIT